MSVEISRETVILQMPIIQRVCSRLEMKLLAPEAVNRYNSIKCGDLTHDTNSYDVIFAMQTIKIWLANTDFSVDSYDLVKTAQANWLNLLPILKEKISEYNSNKKHEPLITLVLSKGRLIRSIGKTELICDLKASGIKIKILKSLPQDGAFNEIDVLLKEIGTENTTEKSLRNAIGEMNPVISKKLNLPPDKSLIEGVQGSGYRINPEWYQIIIID
jgi:hypothetical protein